MNHYSATLTHPSINEPVQTQTRFGEIKSELRLSEDVLRDSLGAPKPSFFRKQIHSRFDNLIGGDLTVIDRHGSKSVEASAQCEDGLQAKVLVGDDKFYRRIILGGTIGSAESYMDGEWVTDDLTSLIRIMIRNLDRFATLENGWARIKNSWHFLQHRFRKNSIEGSRKNIHDHYDLGNDFYRLFLDPTMSYSSGIFEVAADHDEPTSMYQASVRKMDHVCQKLRLNSLDHVLEIGTGWGGLAIHMAKHYGCRVTTTTISQSQFNYAVERVEQEGLGSQVTVLLQDYRNLEGKFNKIVSIEMIEAVGHQFYDAYFSRCSSLLDDQGVMLLQAITIGEQNFAKHIRQVDFIRRYVFPGGCLPSVTALASSVGRSTDMRMLHQEDITPHYVETLACWRNAFMAKLDQVRQLGYSESFIRLWHFYLCYCEAAFAERRVHNTHLIFAKPKTQIDPAAGCQFLRS